jgi:hypothetical protein
MNRFSMPRYIAADCGAIYDSGPIRKRAVCHGLLRLK